MRVLEVTGEPILHGGQEKFIENLIENIDHNDLVIDVLTPYYCENEAFTESVQKFGKGQVYELNLAFTPGKSRRLLLKPIYDFLKTNHYDVVHVHSGSTSVLAYVAKAAHKAKVGKIVVHSHVAGISSIKQKGIRFIMGRLIARNANAFLACSKEAGMAKYPPQIVKRHLKVIKNGINISKYQYDDSRRKAIREQYAINDDTYVLGHVGRFSEQKNHEYLIRLFYEVHNIESDVVLFLVGDGELKSEIIKQVKELEIENHIYFVGNVDNTQDYYQAMDTFLLPSKWEGHPFVTVEAQAAGLPCLVSTSIPEAAIMSDNMKRLDLNEFDSWIRECVSLRKTMRTDNSKRIKQAGYDICTTAAQIRRIYFDQNEEGIIL